MSNRKPGYLKLERTIASDERGGIMHRWNYGRLLLEERAGRQQLPDGMIKDLVAAAAKVGLKISEREIQYRLRFATVYTTDQQVRKVLADLGSWSALIQAGFPAVDVDEQSLDPDDLEAEGFSTAAPDEWGQPTLIPGFGETIKARGRKVPLVKGEEGATVADAKAYLETYRQIHDNFGKTLALIEAGVKAMERGSGGNDEANAVEAYEAGIRAEDDDDGEEQTED
jgi:hypothetical protein